MKYTIGSLIKSHFSNFTEIKDVLAYIKKSEKID